MIVNIKKTFSIVSAFIKKEFASSFVGLSEIKEKGINCKIRLGLPGSGKTLDQTIQDVLPHILRGEQVYCCYWINLDLPNIHYFSEFEEVEHLRNCIVVFDEIGQILPARQWELEGLRVQLWFQLHRHRHIDIIANTQDVSLVAKTVSIVASHWILCQKKNHIIIDWLLRNILQLGFVMVGKSSLTWGDLKKMANGWELDGVLDSSIKQKTKWYDHRKLEFKELDSKKIELVHKYCPLCAMRQGSTIKAKDTMKHCNLDRKGRYTLKYTEYCPKHPTQELQIKKSGLYDTHHEPEIREKLITLQPMIDSPKGYTKIKFQGRMSDRQLIYTKNKADKYNNNIIDSQQTVSLPQVVDK